MQGVGATTGSWGFQNVAPTLLAFPLTEGNKPPISSLADSLLHKFLRRETRVASSSWTDQLLPLLDQSWSEAATKAAG